MMLIYDVCSGYFGGTEEIMANTRKIMEILKSGKRLGIGAL